MKKITIISIALLALVTACAPRLQSVDVALPDRYHFNQSFAEDSLTLTTQWWEMFGDTLLNRLEVEAIANNRNLAATVAKLESARQQIAISRAEYLPSVSGDALFEGYREEGITEHEYSVRPSVSWELSLFGLAKNSRNQAIETYLATESGTRSVMLSLTAQVATTYFTLMQYERSLALATRSYHLRREATALVDSMYSHGMSNGTALMQARSLVYSAKSEMERLRRAATLTAISLGEIVSATPDKINFCSDGDALLSDYIPTSMPIGAPSELLERRPDVMQSYFEMQAAASAVGIQRARRYPSIALSAGAGVFAYSLKGLTSGDPSSWLASAQLTAPIFNFGRLKRSEKAAIEEYNASLYNYEQSIIEAMGEVESALVEISTYKSQATASSALVMANTKIVENSSAMYRSGLGDYLSVIDAERELYSSQIDLIEVMAQQYINYINLFKALGGGW